MLSCSKGGGEIRVGERDAERRNAPRLWGGFLGDFPRGDDEFERVRFRGNLDTENQNHIDGLWSEESEMSSADDIEVRSAAVLSIAISSASLRNRVSKGTGTKSTSTTSSTRSWSRPRSTPGSMERRSSLMPTIILYIVELLGEAARWRPITTSTSMETRRRPGPTSSQVWITWQTFQIHWHFPSSFDWEETPTSSRTIYSLASSMEQQSVWYLGTMWRSISRKQPKWWWRTMQRLFLKKWTTERTYELWRCRIV